MRKHIGPLGRPAVGMALGTGVSRITGLARTVALASALGVGSLSDAYNTANAVPNMLFALVAGGLLGSALVPMLVSEDEAGQREVASVLLGTITAWSIVMAGLLLAAAPWVMLVLTAGAGARDDRDELVVVGVTWLRMFAPQIVLYAVSVTATGIMSAHRKLALGATAPVATNLVTILAAVLFLVLAGGQPALSDVSATGVAVLGGGTTVAVATMAGIQLWGARRTLPGLRFSPRLRHPAVTKLRQLGAWMLLYVAVNQLALVAVIALASAITGGVTAYQWAFMLMQLPYAVVAVSIFSSAYPDITRAAVAGSDLTDVLMGPGWRAITLLLPAAAGLALLAEPLAVALVGSGDVPLVAAGVRGFAASLVPFALFQLLTRASFAGSDTRTPALVNIAVNATMLIVDGVVLLVASTPTTRVTGLALGHASSYVAGCAILGSLLVRRGVLRRTDVRLRGDRVVLGVFGMVVALSALLPQIEGDGRGAAIMSLGAATATGSFVYLGIARRAVFRGAFHASPGAAPPGPALPDRAP